MDSVFQILNVLMETLKEDERIYINGEIMKNKAMELAMKYDARLIKLLLNNDLLKSHFFVSLEDGWVFKQEDFLKVLGSREFLPDSYTAYKNKIGLSNNERFIQDTKDVVLSFPYKDCVLEGGQTEEDKKRNEVFYNEVLSKKEISTLLEPKALTGFRRINKQGESMEFDHLTEEDNLLIKGNNLIALHSLKKRFAGKFRLIYIDPPFATGNDTFLYNDRFTNSTWLTFMKNRLEIAKELLAPNGSIYVHLDYNQSHYCKVLMDEIFGKENFRNEIVWKRKSSISFGKSKFGIVTDSILFYSKTDEYVFNQIFSLDDENTQQYIKERFVYDDGDGRKYMKSPLVNSLYRPNLKYVFEGINPPKNGWLYSKEKMQEFYDNGELIIPDDPDARIYRKIFLDNYKGQVVQSLWTDIPIVNPMAKEQVDFKTQKPEKLLERIVKASTNEGDWVLDFCAGSGTTGIVCQKLGRPFVLVEQMDYIETITLERFKDLYKEKEGGIPIESDMSRNLVYAELLKWNQVFIDKILKASDTEELEAIWNDMQEKAHFHYSFNRNIFTETIETWRELSLEEQKQTLIDSLDHNQLYVHAMDIEDETYNISEEDKQLTRNFYQF